MQKIDCKVLVCDPAVGKTYLASCDDRFIDLDGMKADYKYDLYDVPLIEKERGKLNRGDTIRHDSSKYAINLLNEELKNGKIILLSHNKKIVDYLKSNNIKYCVIYADINAREEYRERMKNRGNNDIFISKMTDENEWNKFYEEKINDPYPAYKIKLEKGKYLSDIKDMFI